MKSSNNVAKIILALLLFFKAYGAFANTGGQNSILFVIVGLLFITAIVGVFMNKRWSVYLTAGIIIIYAIVSGFSTKILLVQTLVDIFILLVVYAYYKELKARSNSR